MKAMSEAAPPPANPPNPPEEFPLEDIDRLLESEDPGFTKSLEEVRAVQAANDVIIEAEALDEALVNDDKFEVKDEPLRVRIKIKISTWWYGLKARLKARLRELVQQAFVFLRTKPKEFLFYALAMSKVGAKKSAVPIGLFRAASRVQKITTLALALCAVAAGWVVIANLKGVWLPQITAPILRSLEPYADHVETYNAKDDGESFYSAFPQERYEFLFPKMKVNLRRTAENPLPMGAFEVIVVVDSKDTAIEVRDRETEFFDLLQRVFEGETFSDLELEAGKNRLKSKVKHELNQKLTQGWIKDINFKTFILKP